MEGVALAEQYVSMRRSGTPAAWQERLKGLSEHLFALQRSLGAFVLAISCGAPDSPDQEELDSDACDDDEGHIIIAAGGPGKAGCANIEGDTVDLRPLLAPEIGVIDTAVAMDIDLVGL